MKPDSSNSLLFDTRTRAVMAQTPSQDGIKELVQAVRQVVLGKSNKDIILVLQYYEHSVERTIQAFLDDGAKDALQEWRSMSVTKTTNKKKKKTKKPMQPSNAAGQSTGETTAAQTSNSEPMQLESDPAQSRVAHHPQSVSKPNEGTNQYVSNKSKSRHVGNAQRSRENSQTEQQNTQATSETPDVSSTAASVALKTVSTAATPVAQLDGAAVSSVEDRATASHVVKPAQGTAKAEKMREPSAGREASRPRDLPEKPHSRSPSHGHSHSTSHSHSVSHSHKHDHSLKHSHAGDGSHSQTVHDDTKRRPHAGLEKSVKDVARQTSSLQRLRLVLGTELDKSFKNVKDVFEEARRELSEREVVVVQHLDQLKEEAYEVLQSRQDKAVELKMKIERAQTMNEEQIQALRSEIKLFVSDRKIDEDLAHTTRFLYDSDHLKEEIKSFGEVIPLKCFYSTRHPSVSSIASSGVSYDSVPLSSPVASNGPALASMTSGSSAVQVLRQTYNVQQVSHEELTDLQKRLQDSRKVKRQPSPPQRAPGKSDVEKSKTGSQNAGQPKSRSAHRRQKQREFDKQAKQNGGGTAEHSYSRNPGRGQSFAHKNSGSRSGLSNPQAPGKTVDSRGKLNEQSSVGQRDNSTKSNNRRPRQKETALPPGDQLSNQASEDVSTKASGSPVGVTGVDDSKVLSVGQWSETKDSKRTPVIGQEDNIKLNVSADSGDHVTNMVNGHDDKDANMNSTKMAPAQPQRKPRNRSDRKASSKEGTKVNGDIIPNGCCVGESADRKPSMGKIGDDLTSLVIDKPNGDALLKSDVTQMSELDSPEL